MLLQHTLICASCDRHSLAATDMCQRPSGLLQVTDVTEFEDAKKGLSNAVTELAGYANLQHDFSSQPSPPMDPILHMLIRSK